MEKPQPIVLPDWTAPDFDPEQMGAQFWYEQYRQQREESQQLRSEEVWVMFLAPTRTAEVQSLLGEAFAGILSRDRWSAYNPQQATFKQKCLAHIGRELNAFTTSEFDSNRHFAEQVLPILDNTRQAYQEYHAGQRSLKQLQNHRLIVDAQLAQVLDHPPPQERAADTQMLANRFTRYGSDWFTVPSHPTVKPDNNDADRALRLVVIHRKVSGGARSQAGTVSRTDQLFRNGSLTRAKCRGSLVQYTGNGWTFTTNPATLYIRVWLERTLILNKLPLLL